MKSVSARWMARCWLAVRTDPRRTDGMAAAADSASSVRAWMYFGQFPKTSATLICTAAASTLVTWPLRRSRRRLTGSKTRTPTSAPSPRQSVMGSTAGGAAAIRSVGLVKRADEARPAHEERRPHASGSVETCQHRDALTLEERPGTRRNDGTDALAELARHRSNSDASLYLPLAIVKDAHDPFWTGKVPGGIRLAQARRCQACKRKESPRRPRNGSEKRGRGTWAGHTSRWLRTS